MCICSHIKSEVPGDYCFIPCTPPIIYAPYCYAYAVCPPHVICNNLCAVIVKCLAPATVTIFIRVQWHGIYCSTIRVLTNSYRPPFVTLSDRTGVMRGLMLRHAHHCSCAYRFDMSLRVYLWFLLGSCTRALVPTHM